ncbi:hypothetical protein ACJ41O_010248 [Fusarium nematophilum]
MPGRVDQNEQNMHRIQTLSIEAPDDFPSPHLEYRTMMQINQEYFDPEYRNHQVQYPDQPPPRRWPQDIWVDNPSFRVLYQPILVLPIQPYYPQPQCGAPHQHLHQHQHQHQNHQPGGGPPLAPQGFVNAPSSPLQGEGGRGNVSDAPLHDASQVRQGEPRAEGGSSSSEIPAAGERYTNAYTNGVGYANGVGGHGKH